MGTFHIILMCMCMHANVACCLYWHYKLGHVDMQQIQCMIHHRALPNALMRMARVKQVPKCKDAYKTKPTKDHTTHTNMLSGIIIVTQALVYPSTMLKPANQVSFGIATYWHYEYFSGYIDHGSHFLYSYNQEGETAAKTLKGKACFQSLCKS